MPFIRVVLLLLLLGISVAVLLQNWVPVVVTVLGVQTQLIALGAVVLAAALMGLLAGVVLQYLLAGAPALRTPQRSWFTQFARRTRRPQKKSATNRAARSDSDPRTSDWYQPAAQDWYERPAKVAVEYDSRSPQEDDPPRSRWSNIFEAENDAASRTAENPGSNRVVDADYRVLRPPNRPLVNPEWEDEFFDDRPS